MVEAKGATEIGMGLPIYIVTCQQITWQSPGNPLTTRRQGKIHGNHKFPAHIQYTISLTVARGNSAVLIYNTGL